MLLQTADGPTTQVKKPTRQSGTLTLAKPRTLQTSAAGASPAPTAGQQPTAAQQRAPVAPAPNRNLTAVTTVAPLTGLPPMVTDAPGSGPGTTTGFPTLPQTQAAPTSTTPPAPGTGPAPVAPAPNAPAPPPAAPPPTVQGARTVGFTGNEQPFQVLPGQNPALEQLMSRLGIEANRQLSQPTVYDDQLFGQITSAEKAGINENFDAAQRALAAELASRGISYSSIAGGKLNDINTARARALSDVDVQNARDRAMALAAGRTAAFNNAAGLSSFLDTTARADRGELRGERSYADALREQARQQALQELMLNYQLQQDQQNSFQDLLNAALGYGQAPGATGMLLSAGGLYGNNAALNAARQQMFDEALQGGGFDIGEVLGLPPGTRRIR